MNHVADSMRYFRCCKCNDTGFFVVHGIIEKPIRFYCECNPKGKAMDNTPIVEGLEAAAATIADPSLTNIVKDFELAIQLIMQLKTLHPALLNAIKAHI